MAEYPIVPVNVIAVLEESPEKNPVVLLHDQEKNRVLPIWVGHPEARGIAISLNPRARVDRPLSHMLTCQAIDALGFKVSRVIVDRLIRHTYCATIFLVREKETIAIDSRPSDAIAIALHARSPLFVAREIMDLAAQENPLKSAQKPRSLTPEEIEKFKDVLEEARKRELEG